MPDQKLQLIAELIDRVSPAAKRMMKSRASRCLLLDPAKRLVPIGDSGAFQIVPAA
jgi:hypothetical protein